MNNLEELLKETIHYSKGLSKILFAETPAQLIFYVTNRCNGRCRHCFYWRELNQAKDELTLLEIKKISASVGRLIWLFLTGGEPFLRDDLVEIAKTFYRNNRPKSIVIPTNGILVDKIVKDVVRIATACPAAKLVIQISVDDIGKRHDQIRGVAGNFAKIETLIPRLKKLQEKHHNLAIQANIVFCRFNQSRVIKIYDYLYRNFKIDNICLSLVRGEPREIGMKQIDLNKYWQAHQYLRQTKRFGQYTSLLSYLITKKEDLQVEAFLKASTEKRVIIPCLAGRQTAVLQPNGELQLCEMRKEKFGNLKEVDYNFNKLWHSAKAERLREKTAGCYCTDECIYTSNVFLNPQVWPLFVKYLVTGKI